jgi:hypothetical protein
MTARLVDRWCRVGALAILAALLVAGWVAARQLEATTASVEVRLTALPAGVHRVVITGAHGYRNVVDLDVPDGSIGDDAVPLGWVRVEVSGICTLGAAVGRPGHVFEVDGSHGIHCSA